MDNEKLNATLAICVADARFCHDTPLSAAIQSGDDIARYSSPVESAPDRRITSNSLLYAASLAKQVVGACLALAAQDGLLNPEDNLSRWFPDLPGWASAVRLEHLLAHTGGLPEESRLLDGMKEAGETVRTTPGMIITLHCFPDLEHAPGTAYSYSNIGYVCLARIVELASNESLAEFSKRRLFAPLAMSNTTFWPGPHQFPPNAVPVEPEPVVGLPFSLGDGGLWTTTDDFLRWNDAMNRDLLGIAEIVQHTSRLNDGSPLEYAWGIRRIDCNGLTGWSHGGSWPGIFAKAVRFPSIDASFVAFTLDTDINPILRLTELVQGCLTSTEDATNARSE